MAKRRQVRTPTLPVPAVAWTLRERRWRRHAQRSAPAVVAVSLVVALAVALASGTAAAPRPQAREGARAATAARAQGTPTLAAPSAAPLLAAASAEGARPRSVVTSDVMVSAPSGLSARQQWSVSHLSGVHRTLVLASGTVSVGRARLRAISAPLTPLRSWMPVVTAQSDPLWTAIAGGAVAASFDVSKNLPLALGSTVDLRGVGASPVRSRVGALASTGLPGIDLAVNPAFGRQLHLVPGAVLLVSSPATDPDALRSRLLAALGPAVTVAVLQRPAPVLAGAAEYLTRAQVKTVLDTALRKVGAPYVWGATGPTSFDCSGLVGYAYAAAGVRLPRVSEQMWLSGLHIRARDALPGDLLFWANDPAAPDDIDHVALYLGNGLMVSAPHTGAVVHVSAVPAQNFRGVVRVVPRLTG
jgi:cell wall-associated NlpC family hydrolase